MSAAPQGDLDLLEEAARRGGACAMTWFADPGAIEEKSPGNPVTRADLEIDALLHDMLRAARPGYGWLSEERRDDGSRLGSGRTFVVDPIDGTRAFIRGQPHFTICLAVVEAGRPVSAVVFNPARDELFSAHAGAGAYCNGVRLQASHRGTLEGARMLVPDGLLRSRLWADQWPDVHAAQRNSIAYRMALVASGRWDAALDMKPKSDWDLAAADLIATEAGAIVTGPDGAVFRYDESASRKPGVICAGPALHALILGRITRSQWKARHS